MNTNAVLSDFAAYAVRPLSVPDAARGRARLVLQAALAGLFVALRSPERTRLIGPVVPGATMPGGARVPGTSLELDPVQATFSMATLIGGSGRGASHVAGLLAVSDWLARRARMEGRTPPNVGDLLTLLVKCCEIDGAVEPLRNGPRVATAAVVSAMLGANEAQVAGALAQAWSESVPPPGSGGWAAADALSRGVQLAFAGVRWGFTAAAVMPAHPLACRAMLDPAIDAEACVRRFEAAVAGLFSPRQAAAIRALFAEPRQLEQLAVNDFVAMFVVN